MRPKLLRQPGGRPAAARVATPRIADDEQEQAAPDDRADTIVSRASAVKPLTSRCPDA